MAVNSHITLSSDNVFFPGMVQCVLGVFLGALILQRACFSKPENWGVKAKEFFSSESWRGIALNLPKQQQQQQQQN